MSFVRAILCLLVIAALAQSAAGAAPVAPAPASSPTTLPTTEPAPLTTAAAVRQLTPAQAALRPPVRIRGVVTFLGSTPPVMFVQDATGGVCIAGPRDREVRLQVKSGVTVDIDGLAAPGRLVPFVTGRGKDPVQIAVVDDDPPMRPSARPTSLAELNAPALHGTLVEVEGVVRSVRVETMAPAVAEALVVTLAAGRDRVEAAYLGWRAGATPPEHWVGSTVKVRGVYNSAGPERPAAATMRLLFPNVKELRVQAAAAPPFELPVTAVAAVAAPSPADVMVERVRVQGTVTLPIADKGFYLQGDGGGGVWVERPPGKLRAGDRIDVAGFPAPRGWAAALEDPVWRNESGAGLPDSPLVTGEQALAGTFDRTLVRVDALVLEVSRLAEGPTLVLQSGERVFLARLASPAPNASFAPMRENSWVRVTGVCINNRIPEAPAEGALANPPRPVSFHLLLNSPGAVDVIKAPGWWTSRRVLAVCGALAVVAVAAFAWVFALRRRVARQTALIREHLARETVYEERVRIARDLHDSVGQDLLGITMQLNATEKLLAEPGKARQSLQVAAAMARRSQVETHRAIWDLRDSRTDRDGIVGTIREAVAGLSQASGPNIEVNVSGEAHALPTQVENHLLRVALEAVTNAVKHAGARQVIVDLTFDPGRVALRVTDDGRGFDARQMPLPSSGHFGLFGMRERAEKLKADLAITSEDGHGTQVHMAVPLPTNGAAVETRTARAS